MNKLRRLIFLLLLPCIALGLCGCSLFAPLDELYSLPQASDNYIQLQELIDQELENGCEYAAPTGGSFRQSIQLADLDGDGTQEALAFFRSEDQTLRISIYAVRGGHFSPVAAISGEGAAIGGIDYADMDGDGLSELIVAWQALSDQKILCVYSMVNLKCSLLLTADCTEFHLADLNSDSVYELISLRMDTPEYGTVEMYSLTADGEIFSTASRLSSGISSLERIRSGTVLGGRSALYVESYTADGNVVTDIFVSDGENLNNISLGDKDISNTLRDYDVFCSDIDGNGTMDVPFVQPLHSQSEGSPLFRALDWYDYSAEGNKTFCFSTYHCYSDGWYIVLPDSLPSSQLSVRREDRVYGERIVVLSKYDEASNSVSDMLSVYTLTGDNRYDRAAVGDRFILRQDSTTVFAARLSPGCEFSQEQVKDMFNIIYSEWKTGAL